MRDMAKGTKKSKSDESGPRLNKSAWIRAIPNDIPAKEVVDKAKSEGIQLSLAQVYTARSTAKVSTGKRGRPPGSGRLARGGRGPAATRGEGSDKATFRRLVLAIGLERAESYFDELKRSLGF